MATQLNKEIIRAELIKNTQVFWIREEDSPKRRSNKVRYYCEHEANGVDEDYNPNAPLTTDDEIVAMSQSKHSFFVALSEKPNGRVTVSKMVKGIKYVGHCSLSKSVVLKVFGLKRMSAKLEIEAMRVLTDVAAWSYYDNGEDLA
jgi:hypothetical protein